MSMAAPSLEVVDLRVEIEYGAHEDIVDGISFQVAGGEVLGLVGESGSGKTTVGLALLGHTRRGARIARGEVRIEGRDILPLPPLERQRLRGRLVSYVPQDPASALSPAMRIGTQLEETLSEHGFGASNEERHTRIVEVLGEVLLPSDDTFLRRYPHQLSGGQQQRVALAMAFANRPRVIVLDEPTTGLDVTTQAHVLETVRDLCAMHGVAAVYVSHDLAVVATLATRVAVLYGGRLAEVGPTGTLFRLSAHPYTRRLVEAIPELSGAHALVGIPGTAPRPGHRPPGCFFAPRCPYAEDQCTAAAPPLETIASDHVVRCFRHEEVMRDAVAVRPAATARAEIEDEDALVTVREVDAWYGIRHVVHDVELVIRPRECLALVGESGSGKTTLARCIAGLHTAYSGEIAYRGQPLEPGSRARDADGSTRDPVRLPEPVQLAQPSEDDRADRRPAARSSSSRSRRTEAQRRIREALESRPALDARARSVPASAVGRRAPARSDRPRADREPAAARLRRGHIRTGRLRSGRDHRRPRGSPASSSTSGCSSSRTISP